MSRIAATLQTLASSSRMKRWTARISISTAGTGAELALRFVRTVILSRLLLPVEFGVGVAITALIFTSELVSDIGLERFVMTISEHSARRTLATAHVLQLARGMTIALGVVMASGLLSQLLGIPEYRTSFMLVGGIIVVRGFNHLGVKQIQRNFNYRPEAIAIATTQILTLAIAVVAGYFMRDHRAFLVVFGVEALIYASMTHLLASSPYVLSFDRETGRAALSFGLPLIVSGISLAVASQADRFLVGHFLGIKTLALYGAVLTIATVPIASVYRILSSLSLPLLVRDREDPKRLEATYRLLNWTCLLLGSIYSFGLAVGLDVATPMIFGKAYIVPWPMHPLVAVIVLVRMLRWPPTVLALALGRTQRLALTNIVVGVGLAVAAGILVFRPEMFIVLSGVLLGEIAALALFQYIMNKEDKAIGRSALYSIGAGVMVASSIVCGLALLPEASIASRLALIVAFVPFVALVAIGLLRSWHAREASGASLLTPTSETIAF